MTFIIVTTVHVTLKKIGTFDWTFVCVRQLYTTPVFYELYKVENIFGRTGYLMQESQFLI